MFAIAHQGQLYLVLNLFNMDRAAGGHTAFEGGTDLLGQTGNHIVDTGRGGSSAAFYGQKRLADGHGDLVIIVADNLAVALDDAQLAWCCAGNVLVLFGAVTGLGGSALRVLAHIRLHVALSVVLVVVLFCLL